MKNVFLALLLIPIILSSSCGWIDGLREEVAESVDEKADISSFDYKSPYNRDTPPPPATLNDTRLKKIEGSPVDYSGTRIKSGRVTKDDFFKNAAKNEASLWAEEGQTNYLFSRNNLKAPGDLLTIVIEDDLRNDMVSEVKTLLPPEYRLMPINVPGLTRPEGEEKRVIAANPTLAQLKPEDYMVAEVVERYPNGNLRIRGVKKIPFRSHTRTMEVGAILREASIKDNDMVRSSSFFEHRVELYR